MELDLIGQLEKNATAPTSMISPPVDVKLELSLGLGSGEGEPKKPKKPKMESDEAFIEKKPKIEEESVMPAIFPKPISCCYACLISDWVPICMEDIGNNVYEQRDKLSFTLETDGVDESSSPESGNSGTSVLHLFC